jgi:hypothetical protein
MSMFPDIGNGSCIDNSRVLSRPISSATRSQARGFEPATSLLIMSFSNVTLCSGMSVGTVIQY